MKYSENTYLPLLHTFKYFAYTPVKLLSCIVGAILLGLSANISIPTTTFIPFTLQSFCVLLIGASFGSRLGTATITLYLFIGCIGLPVFAQGSSGLSALTRPTSGYLYGFLISSYLAGWFAERGWDRKFYRGVFAFAVSHQVIFIFGVLFLSISLEKNIVEAFYIGYKPFFGPDILKFTAAALLFSLIWKTRVGIRNS